MNRFDIAKGKEPIFTRHDRIMEQARLARQRPCLSCWDVLEMQRKEAIKEEERLKEEARLALLPPIMNRFQIIKED